MTKDQRAAGYAGYIECFMQRKGSTEISMTDATEAIGGTSGRGNPKLVNNVEVTAMMGYLTIRQDGKRKRIVTRTDKPISQEAFSAEDRRYAMEA